MAVEHKKDIGHAARAAEGRTLWMAAWKKAWSEAEQAAATAESRAFGSAESRRQWAVRIAAARDLPPPYASDAQWNEAVIPAWNAAWKAAWDAAIGASRISLEERSRQEQPGVKQWDRAGRDGRSAEGLAAGCVAWNDIYRSEIKKIN